MMEQQAGERSRHGFLTNSASANRVRVSVSRRQANSRDVLFLGMTVQIHKQTAIAEVDRPGAFPIVVHDVR